MNLPKIKTYPEWLKDNPYTGDPATRYKRCPDCMGRGWVRCSECGGEKECSTCDEGEVDTYEDTYHDAIDEDFQKWKGYQRERGKRNEK